MYILCYQEGYSGCTRWVKNLAIFKVEAHDYFIDHIRLVLRMV